jgi:Amidase
MLRIEMEGEIAADIQFVEATIAGIQEAMTAGRLTSAELVDRYLERIERLDQNGPRLNSVIEVNPDAHDIAEQLDKERKEKGVRGPLHGLPVLLKDNIDTGDRMQTSTGITGLKPMARSLARPAPTGSWGSSRQWGWSAGLGLSRFLTARIRSVRWHEQ